MYSYQVLWVLEFSCKSNTNRIPSKRCFSRSYHSDFCVHFSFLLFIFCICTVHVHVNFKPSILQPNDKFALIRLWLKTPKQRSATFYGYFYRLQMNKVWRKVHSSCTLRHVSFDLLRGRDQAETYKKNKANSTMLIHLCWHTGRQINRIRIFIPKKRSRGNDSNECSESSLRNLKMSETNDSKSGFYALRMCVCVFDLKIVLFFSRIWRATEIIIVLAQNDLLKQTGNDPVKNNK